MTLPRSWEASYWGQLFTQGRPWRITLEASLVEITTRERTLRPPIAALRAVTIKRGLFWSSISFTPKGEHAPARLRLRAARANSQESCS